jgi:hypothetical protein
MFSFRFATALTTSTVNGLRMVHMSQESDGAISVVDATASSLALTLSRSGIAKVDEE